MGVVRGRPRLLFLCQTLPYPPDGGVWIRTYHVLRVLSQVFDVTALCFERASSAGRWSTADIERSREALGRFGEVEVFGLPQRRSAARFAWDHARSLVRRRVYTAYLYESQAFARRQRSVLRAGDVDLVHLDSLDLARCIPVCGRVPVVVVHHDVESDLLARRAAVERSPWRRAYFAYQSRLMRAVERQWCSRVALNVTTSERDAARLQDIAPGSRIAVVPNGVDVAAFGPTGGPDDGIAYVGGTSPHPNLDALEFFCDGILPHIRRVHPRVTVRWIGRATREQQARFGKRYGVVLTGYVEDPVPLMRAARCHVVPLRIGGGTRLKILNAWAMGKPVVTTAIGCEGLEARDGDNLLVRDDPRAFAAAAVAVLGDASLRSRLADAGRATAERHYSWDVIAQPMLEAYAQVAHRRGKDNHHAAHAVDAGAPAARPA